MVVLLHFCESLQICLDLSYVSCLYFHTRSMFITSIACSHNKIFLHNLQSSEMSPRTNFEKKSCFQCLSNVVIH